MTGEAAAVPHGPNERPLPALVLPAVIVYPGLMAPLLVEEGPPSAAVESAAARNEALALFVAGEGQDLEAAPEVGVSARIARLVRLPAGVSASPTVNGTAPVLVLAGMPRSVTSEIAGGVFGGGGGGDTGTVLVRVKVAGDATPAAVAVTV